MHYERITHLWPILSDQHWQLKRLGRASGFRPPASSHPEEVIQGCESCSILLRVFTGSCEHSCHWISGSLELSLDPSFTQTKSLCVSVGGGGGGVSE